MKINILDIETTSLEPEIGHIVEIGIVTINVSTYEITTTFDSIVKESGFGSEEKDAWIFNNSDLKYIDVIDATYLENIRDEVQMILNKYPTTAFHKEFDFGYLKTRDFQILNELPCIMLEATPICKIPGYYGNYKWPKAQETWDYFFPDSDYIEKHRAADDAFHEALILFEMYKRGDYQI